MIDNPYYGLKNVGTNYIHDCTSVKIPVPCGNCSSCIALRQNYYIQRTQMEALNNHLFMCTLTYKPSSIPREVVNDRILYYPDWSDLQKMFKRLRNAGHVFKYLAVSEYGGANHRPHFHLIISVPKGSKDTYHDIMNLEVKWSKLFLKEWRRNYGSDRKPKYKPLCRYVCTYSGRTFDFHYINPASTLEGEADVAFYVTKYLLKADKWVDRLKSALKLNLKEDDFLEIWKKLKPRACISKGWGDPDNPAVINHIRKGIDISKESNAEFPWYISPTVGNTFPLSPFYQRRFLTMEDKLHYFFFSNNQISDDGMKPNEDYNPDMNHYQTKRLERVRKLINNRLITKDNCYDFEELKNMAYDELEDNSSSLNPCYDDWTNDFES